MKTLPPQTLRDIYWQDVEDQLKSIFYEIVFAPVMEVLRKANPQVKKLPQEIRNAGWSALIAAIRSGQVQYQEGEFSGQFNVAISKDLRSLGASLDGKMKVYKLPVEQVPAAIRAEAAAYQETARAAHKAVNEVLDKVQQRLDDLIKNNPIDAEETVRRMEKGFERSADILKIQPKLSKDATARLSQDYTKNISLYISDFSKQSIQNLREAVENNALEGYRFDRLTEMIRHRYGVMANKAKFLARQETSLFMAKYRKQRFGDAGVQRYKWSTAHDERVRHSHKVLNGRIFSYDDPPITDPTTGARNNPGEDFNCRCVDIPILEPAFVNV